MAIYAVKKTAALFAGALVLSTAVVPVAYADDPLAPIVATILKDRHRACGDVHFGDLTHAPIGRGFVRNQQLEEQAQAYAHPPHKAPLGRLPGSMTVVSFIGIGDPQAQAINQAYRNGAGAAIGNCNYKKYGVGFYRDEKHEIDLVTIVVGTLR